MRARICPFSKRMWTDVKRDWCQSRRELRLRLRIKHGHISTPSAARSDGRKTRETDGRFAKFPKGIHGSLESRHVTLVVSHARAAATSRRHVPPPHPSASLVTDAAAPPAAASPPPRKLFRAPFRPGARSRTHRRSPSPARRALRSPLRIPVNALARQTPMLYSCRASPLTQSRHVAALPFSPISLSVSLPPCLSPSPCSLAVTPRAGNLISCPARAGDIAVA